MNKLAIGILSFSMFLAACENPADNKPKATVNNTNTTANAPTNAPANTGAATVKTAKGEAITVSNENSKVGFTGSKVTGKHDGGFNKFTGTIDLVNNKIEESSVSVDIDMASVFSDADGLTKHLQTGDFFEVEKHPKSTFASTKIVADSAKGADNYTVTGDLEMRGVKKSITFPAKITANATDVAVDAEFAINRKDFGIAYAGKADDLIRDEVVIKLNLKAPRKK
ncbi:MAG: YceI family protein [Pyrinomonadaceae bacterium]|jgi:polyisoprenoid-binding protein YceI|nr:YceI family protein [Pyrinomonadaceae bacterium]